MKSGRRSFLKFAGIASATATAGVAAGAVVHAAAPEASLTRSAFAPLVGQEFVFETSALEKLTTRLVGVEALQFSLPGQKAEGAFRIEFETPAGQALKQDTFAVSHPRLGRFALFVSPNDREGRVVEAIFNRI